MRYFEDIDWVIGAVSRKVNGPMKRPPEEGNKTSFLRGLGLDPAGLATPVLEHGSFVKRAEKGSVGHCDGLVTNEKEIILSITVADCLPIFLVDPEKRVIGLLHAGWRGLTKKIVANAITLLSGEFNSEVGRLRAVIGPGICRGHFEVGDDVAPLFKQYPEAIDIEGKRRFVDIKEVAKTQLVEAGLDEGNIEIDGDCTFCLDREYFSYRRDGPEETGTMLCILAFKK